MQDKLKNIFENLIPFMLIGIAIALFIGLVGIFFYIALWGLIIGGVLWVTALVKQYFFPKQPVIKKQGRVIEHDEEK